MRDWDWGKAEEEMLALIEQLVNIDSGTLDKEGVDRVGAILAEEYGKLGFSAEKDWQSERGDNLLVIHKEAEEPDILIVAHMDTVFPRGTAEARPFSRGSTQAYGPGVADMKGSQVMVLYALKHLIASGREAYRKVRIVLNSDEEIGSVHSRALIEQQARLSRYALIVEPSDDQGRLVTRRRGGGKYELHIQGVAAHAGAEPEKGRSAIEDLAHKVIKLHALTDASAGVNVNVGVVGGGTSVNTIAPNAFARIDVRMQTAEQAERLDRQIREICETPDVEGTSAELTGGITRPPMIKTVETACLLDQVLEEARNLGEKIRDSAVGSGSDGNLTAALGIPTIDGLGPRGGKLHSAEEYLRIDTLVPRAKLLVAVLERLAASETSHRPADRL
ncbi:carboxypeptidase [Saccharibacillus sp. O23]|uniref:M20 family metallopeptidase n=1 Tax=Saccharibacillus sp. O23 TaxID=2009338 RepID=UPI000B4E60B4|nr:M20 family metallopeptidase [Saccharibacillus sp. O23]OWR30896.1 carboxypeptidase [Saccharibacillus sp. O23]